MIEQRAPDAPAARLGPHGEVERHAGVLPEREMTPQGTDGRGSLARTGCEALDEIEGGSVVKQVAGSQRQQPPAVVPGVAPGCEPGIPDVVEAPHPPRR